VKTPKECRDYLTDILAAADEVSRFVAGVDFDQFCADRKTVYAVIHAIEIMGEAVRSIPPDIRKQYPNIPWRDMAGMRDRLIHGYRDINLKIVWNTVTEDLPAIVPKLREMLDELGG
jgi:uncharacterized protein with HEPN domain